MSIEDHTYNHYKWHTSSHGDKEEPCLEMKVVERVTTSVPKDKTYT